MSPLTLHLPFLLPYWIFPTNVQMPLFLLFLKISLNPTSSSSLSPISLFLLQLMAFKALFVLTDCNSSSSCVLEPFQQDFHAHRSTDTTLFKVNSDFDFGGFSVLILLILSAATGTVASSLLLEKSSPGFQNCPAPYSSPSPPHWLVLLSFLLVFSFLLSHKH